MAEFCLECWNKIMDTNDLPKKFYISRQLDLCEECGQWKPVILAVRRRYILKEWFTDLIASQHIRRQK